jgi:hypothetical protein
MHELTKIVVRTQMEEIIRCFAQASSRLQEGKTARVIVQEIIRCFSVAFYAYDDVSLSLCVGSGGEGEDRRSPGYAWINNSVFR